MLLEKIKDEMNGKAYITTKELLTIGVSKSSISRLVSNGQLIRVSRGMYSLEDDFVDVMFILQNKYKAGIFSHESALYIHGLTDRNPEKHVMTVSRNYKVSKSNDYEVQFKYADKSLLELGKEIKLSDMGNEIYVYNIERTICDVIKSDTKMDPFVVNQAIRQYAAKGKWSILMIYAEKMGMTKKVRKKLEVLL